LVLLNQVEFNINISIDNKNSKSNKFINVAIIIMIVFIIMANIGNIDILVIISYRHLIYK